MRGSFHFAFGKSGEIRKRQHEREMLPGIANHLLVCREELTLLAFGKSNVQAGSNGETSK